MPKHVDGLHGGNPPRSHVRLTVQARADAFAAAVMIRRMVESKGGTRRDAAAASIAAAELVQNIVTHAGGRGHLLAWFEDDVIVVQAVDRGPGAVNPQRLFAGGDDGTAVRSFGSLGEGCGAVRRLMDRVRVRDNEHGGLEVTAYKCMTRGGPRAPWS